MTLRDAYRQATTIRDRLAEYCDRIEIAGSIRRACDHVNDVDLVLLPKPGAYDSLVARIKARTTLVREGATMIVVTLANGVQLDCWFATHPTQELLTRIPGTWGTVLMCRTGSRAHNIWVCQQAAKLGLKWVHTIGLCEMTRHGEVARVVAGETEESIYETLGVKHLAPIEREMTPRAPVPPPAQSDPPDPAESAMCHLPSAMSAAPADFSALHAALDA